MVKELITTDKDFELDQWVFRDLKISRANIPPKRVSQLAKANMTSGGVLAKFNLKHDKLGLLYVKSGSASGNYYRSIEPLMERLCCQIGKLLGFDILNYRLWAIDKICFNSISKNDNIEFSNELGGVAKISIKRSFDRAMNEEDICLVSVSQDFVNKNKFNSIRSLFGELKGKKLYQRVTSLAIDDVKCKIGQMIVFDYLVNNTDRHTMNFGIIVNKKGIGQLAPLFDHGLSFCAEFSDSEIDEFGMDLLGFNKGEPFGGLSGALELVDKTDLGDIDFTVTVKDLHEVVNRYKTLISDVRLELILNTLERRWEYVRKIFS